MKFYWNMPKGLKKYYRTEMTAYKTAFERGHLPLAWHYLERAHILAQAWPREHSAVHWKMLQFGLHIKSAKEVIGQIPRLLVGGVKSFVGKIPVGNTGGANVPPLQPMEIPYDLQHILVSNK
jgi:hypothetical protein